MRAGRAWSIAIGEGGGGAPVLTARDVRELSAYDELYTTGWRLRTGEVTRTGQRALTSYQHIVDDMSETIEVDTQKERSHSTAKVLSSVPGAQSHCACPDQPLRASRASKSGASVCMKQCAFGLPT